MINTIKSILADAEETLKAHSDSPRVDVELLLGHILNKDRSFFYTWPEYELEHQQLLDFQKLLKQRLNGKPIAHIIGQRGFWSLNLKVTSDTLIPRPDTERLVELALDIIPQNKKWRILDLGTGSGAIALAIASERPLCEIVATDYSAAALAIAKENAKTHKLNNIQFLKSHWFENIEPQRFDLIASNPPYICDNDSHLSQGDVRFEPISALTSGTDGLNDIKMIIKQAKPFLNHGSTMLIEHGFEQANPVIALFEAENYQQIKNYKDYAGLPRVTMALLP